ncbi:hypothetical protein LTR66_000508 [Elasticomyces elasticus]|nr:hypothetical protein LTR50_003055 [Elasticomyces elasticus]KAK5000661.1 hypothetical protein LTR66_000508 [Elasticomyces elasticus]
MLALTECKLGDTRIAAAAVNEPIVDWIFPESQQAGTVGAELDRWDQEDQPCFVDEREKTIVKRSARKRMSDEPSFLAFADNACIPAARLLAARRTLFRRPAHYFDPFASPALFFRSPGADLPPLAKDDVLDDFAELSLLEQDEARAQVSVHRDYSDPGSGQAAVHQTLSRRRKVARKHPPSGSALRLPDMRISVGEYSPLYDQAAELAMLMRRSIVRQEQPGYAEDVGLAKRQAGGSDEPGKFDRSEDVEELAVTAEADRRIKLTVKEELGPWACDGTGTAWRREITKLLKS